MKQKYVLYEQSKTLDNYYLNKNKGTHRSMCIKCSSEKRSDYYSINKEKLNKQTNQYKAEKMKVDPAFKLERKCRTMIYNAFKS